MASTFSGIAVASNSLANSQYSMYVTSTNISNANTEGYSVQSVKQSSGASGVKYSTTTGGSMSTTTAEQVQSYYINTEYREAESTYSYWESSSTLLSNVQNSYHALDDTGFSALYDSFVTEMSNLATTPDDEAARALMAESAQSFCDSFNQTALGLLDQQSMINDQVETTVTEINSLAEQIADLNNEIKMTALEGGNTNTLQDQQDLLIDELSSLVDVDVNMLSVSMGSSTYETVQISIGGTALVTDAVVSELEIVSDDQILNGEPKYDVVWASSGEALDCESGELASLIEVRDGDSATEKGIPYYMEELDTWARTFAEAFNEGYTDSDGNAVSGHTDGYGLNGETGSAFFTNEGMGSDTFYAQNTDTDLVYENIRALNLSVNEDIIEDTDLIAVSSESGEEGNAENLQALIDMTDSNAVFGTSTPKEAMTAGISTLSANVSYAETNFSSAETDYELYTTWRMSQTSVSVDEEAAKLESYQLSYNASAKVIEIWNEVIEATIGLVGG